MHPKFNLGITGVRSIHAEINGGGGQVSRAEENQGKLQGVWGGDGSAIPPPPHGDSTGDSRATDPGGISRQMVARDIFSVLPTGSEVCGKSGGQVPGEGTQLGKI